ncbi:MAG: RNA polymerase sigma factor [Planctomycetota bacterium]
MEANRGALHAFVRLNAGKFLLARESCSDLVQTVFHELLSRRDRFKLLGARELRAWLFQAARSKIKGRRRYYAARKRSASYEVPIEGRDGNQEALLLESYHTIYSPSRDAIAREQIARIELAFEGLPEDYREVITLSRLAGWSHAEIARETGRSEVAVRTLLFRGLARLSELLEAP